MATEYSEGEKETYWGLMNGFNTSHEGISADDFVECRMSWESEMMKAFKAEQGYETEQSREEDMDSEKK